MKQPKLKLSSLALAIAGSASLSVAVSAAELEEVIVTGTPGGAAVNQLDAAFSITSHDADDITKFSPKSTADLFKTVPGVWAESSGGVSGANVFVRGLPITGDADFLTVSLQGSPIYGFSTLSFFEQSTIFRIDETIERMEALRGGANTLFSNAQPGLTTNFILKEGSENSEGLVKLTVGDYNLVRADAVHSGPLGGGWNYMIGGYVSRSDGIRDAGFTSEKGQQVTVNLTKDFEDGKISVYNRYTDDFGTWYLPIPIGVPGVDAGEFTQISPANRNERFAIHPSRAGETIDLGNGRGWDGNVFGINFEKDFGNVTVSNRFNYTTGDNDTHGLVPDGGAIQAGSVPGTGIRVSDGSVVGSDTFVQGYGYWIVEKDLDAVSNDLALTFELGDHSLTAGIYYADYSSYDEWSIGNQQPYELRGSRLTGITCEDLQTAGTGAACWGTAGPFAPAYDGNAENLAFYLHDRWQVNDKVALDVGLRREDYDADFDIAFADASGLGAFTNTQVEEDETTYTVGLNYNLNDNSSVFLRVNEGVTFPHFDNIRQDQLEVREITQYEIGYKWQSESSHIYLALFDSELKGNTFEPFPGAPLSITTDESLGIEVDANYNNGNGFNLNLNATLQDTEQVEGSNPANIGNSAPRIPDNQIRVTPSYDFNLGELVATIYGTVTWVDDRFGDQANDQDLPSFTKLDLGVLLNQGENWTYQLVIDNATDDEGLTEGDPRVTAGVASNARPILGRSIKASIQYNF